MQHGPSARFRIGSAGVARVLALVCGLAFALGACSSSGGAPSGRPTASGGASAGGGAGAAGLSFNLALQAVSPDDGTTLAPLALKPGEVADIVVTTTPPAEHTVRFALIGNAFDAVLDATFVDTDATTGMSSVTLTAPSTPTDFGVRASAMGASSLDFGLSVQATNMALLAVEPSYPGERVLYDYVASASLGVTCADLTGSPPPDADLSAKSDAWPVPLQVPTGTKLAVVLRAAKFAWGCTTLNGASEGVQNDVEVVMANVPMKLDTSTVDFELDLDAFDAFDQALATPSSEVTDGILGSATDDVEALLDAMAQASDDDTFAPDRTEHAWDAQVRSALGASATDALRAPLSRWIQTGIADLPMSGGLTGTLTGRTGSTAPTVALDQVFGVGASQSGFAPSDTPASWEAGADDSVIVGLSLSVSPAQFLLAEARGPALAEVTDAQSVAEALAEAVPCATVASALLAAGETSGHSTKSCDAGCTKQLCVDAVQALTDAALDADGAPWTLDVALSVSGQVGDDAELANFAGQWLGRLTTPDGSSSLTGDATGAPPK